MKINLRLKLISTQTSPVRIKFEDKTFDLKDKETLSIEKKFNISPSDNHITSSPILAVQNFKVGSESKLEIDSFCINSIDVDQDEMQDFLSFEVFDNKWVENHTLEKISTIHLNGNLNLIVKGNLRKFFWSPFYSSNKRNDFVYDNRLTSVFKYNDEVLENMRPWQVEIQMDKKQYNNIPHPPLDENNNYEFGCFGCSVTHGVGLNNDQIWPSLLSKNHLNLALSSLGVDGIYLNLVNALKKFKWDTTVIILPNWERKIMRFTLPSGEITRVPSTLNTEWAHTLFKHWSWKTFNRQLSRDDLNRWKKLYNKSFKFLMEDRFPEYSRRVLDKIVKVCHEANKPLYLSSWDEETYDYLESHFDNVLPFFEKIDYAQDQAHPGPKSHMTWVDKSMTKLT
jgi:hypothetical protein